MIGYQSLVEAVQHTGDVPEGQEAGLVVGAVLNAVAQVVPPPTRKELAGRLPGSLRTVVDVSTPVQEISGGRFLAVLAERIGTEPERARYLTQAVLEEMQIEDDDIARSVWRELPPELADELRPSGEPPSGG